MPKPIRTVVGVTTISPEQQATAARLVRRHARDREDERELLAALGLTTITETAQGDLTNDI